MISNFTTIRDSAVQSVSLQPREIFRSDRTPVQVAAAQGKGFLEEFVARFEQTPITDFNSTTNSTFDSNPTYFPLNQSIYADATHEVVLLDTLTAFNLTALFSSGALPVTGPPASQSFIASQIVPFATHLTIQVLECPIYKPTKQIRFIL